MLQNEGKNSIACSYFIIIPKHPKEKKKEKKQVPSGFEPETFCV